MRKIKTISMFTGCGGLDLGFQQSAYKVGFMADILPEAIETLRHNHNDVFIYGPDEYSGDISELTGKFIKEKSGFSEIDMIIGGPPCQPFSVAAAQRFLKDDKRFKRTGFQQEKGQLIFEYLRIIKELEPKAFLIENVPGLVKIDNGKTVKDLISVFESLGYFVKTKIIDASEFGVPQKRERVFIIANKVNPNFEFPVGLYNGESNPTLLKNGNGNKKVISAQALAYIDSSTQNHETRIHKMESVDRYRKLKIGEREHKGRVDRLDPDSPSKTIIAGGSAGGGRSHLHPYLARTLSVRECARLQTFPDDFIFKGKNSRQFTQVGNAVPPLLAEQIARSIGSQVFGLTYKGKLKSLMDYNPSIEAKEHLLSKAISDSNYIIYDDVRMNMKTSSR